MTYAILVQRLVLPVSVLPTNVDLLPNELQRLQMIDYSKPSRESLAKLVGAINQLPQPPPLPDPLPDPPKLPVPRIFVLRQMLNSPEYLDPPTQFKVLNELRLYATKPRLTEEATTLLVDFRQRSDITAEIQRQVDTLLEWPVEQEKRTKEYAEEKPPVHKTPIKSPGPDQLPPARSKTRNAMLLVFDSPWYSDWTIWLAITSLVLGIAIGVPNTFAHPQKGLPDWLQGIFWGVGCAIAFGVIPAVARLRIRRVRLARFLTQLEDVEQSFSYMSNSGAGSTEVPDWVTRLQAAAEQDPSQAMFRAWRHVESVVARLGDQAGLAKARNTAVALAKAGILREATSDRLNQLDQLRNKVIHGRVYPSKDNALTYIELARTAFDMLPQPLA
jgi:hypothetical protein